MQKQKLKYWFPACLIIGVLALYVFTADLTPDILLALLGGGICLFMLYGIQEIQDKNGMMTTCFWHKNK